MWHIFCNSLEFDGTRFHKASPHLSAPLSARRCKFDSNSFTIFYLYFFAGTSILKITATSMNGQPVAYTRLMEHGDFDHFEIKGDGTIVSGEDSFDYETRPLYRMQFRARESDQLFSTCLVEIKVKDVNDNSPKFPTESYDGRILENSPKGTPVIRVHANDADTGAGGEVRSCATFRWLDRSSIYILVLLFYCLTKN